MGSTPSKASTASKKYYKGDYKGTITDYDDWITANPGNTGIILNYKISKMAPPHLEFGTHEKGFYYESWGNNTLAKFLLYLNRLPGALPTLH